MPSAKHPATLTQQPNTTTQPDTQKRTTPDVPSQEASTNQTTPAPELLNPEPRTLTTPSNPRQQARAFYERHKKQMDQGSSVLWPQVEDLYTSCASAPRAAVPPSNAKNKTLPSTPNSANGPKPTSPRRSGSTTGHQTTRQGHCPRPQQRRRRPPRRLLRLHLHGS